MNVIKSTVEKIRLTNIEGFRYGSISIFLEDFNLGQGAITIECDGDAWSYYWGNMGEKTLKDFLKRAETSYLVHKLDMKIDERIDDESADALSDHAMKWIIQERRDRNMTREQAREAWSEAESIVDDGVFRNESRLQLIFGDFWHEHLPTKLNSKYQHLYEIVDHIKKAIRQELF